MVAYLCHCVSSSSTHSVSVILPHCSGLWQVALSIYDKSLTALWFTNLTEGNTKEGTCHFNLTRLANFVYCLERLQFVPKKSTIWGVSSTFAKAVTVWQPGMPASPDKMIIFSHLLMVLSCYLFNIFTSLPMYWRFWWFFPKYT